MRKTIQVLHGIWRAETQADAEKAFDLFIKTYEPKHPEAVIRLHKDREAPMASYNFPVQHWQGLRTRRSEGRLSREGMLHMMFKPGQCAGKKWNRLRGFDYLTKVVARIQFRPACACPHAGRDGAEVTEVGSGCCLIQPSKHHFWQ